jgi:hypothetical protein
VVVALRLDEPLCELLELLGFKRPLELAKRDWCCSWTARAVRLKLSYPRLQCSCLLLQISHKLLVP